VFVLRDPAAVVRPPRLRREPRLSGSGGHFGVRVGA
jgi:hypothetical protein